MCDRCNYKGPTWLFLLKDKGCFVCIKCLREAVALPLCSKCGKETRLFLDVHKNSHQSLHFVCVDNKTCKAGWLLAYQPIIPYDEAFI